MPRTPAPQCSAPRQSSWRIPGSPAPPCWTLGPAPSTAGRAKGSDAGKAVPNAGSTAPPLPIRLTRKRWRRAPASAFYASPHFNVHSPLRHCERSSAIRGRGVGIPGAGSARRAALRALLSVWTIALLAAACRSIAQRITSDLKAPEIGKPEADPDHETDEDAAGARHGNLYAPHCPPAHSAAPPLWAGTPVPRGRGW